MKSFQNFINLTERTVGSSGRPSQSLDPQEQDIEDFKRETGKRKTRSSVEAARERLAATPVLTDDEMRAQNPSATAAYEKDVKERQARRSVTVDTPEGQITAGGASRSGKIPIQTSSGRTIYVTPDEAIVRAEAGLKPPVKNKPKKVTSTSKFSTQPTPAPAAVKPPKIDLSKYKAPQVNLGTLKPVPAKATRLAPSATSSTSNLASTVNSIVRRNKAVEKVASRAASQTLKNIGRAATIAGTAFDVQQGYKASREEGGSVKRAIGAGISRGAGGLVGAATGARIGGMLAGAPGAVVGGVVGYTGGAEGLSNVYKKVTGDVGKKLTTQGVLTNIRKAVPQELRAQVPAGARKTFTDFVKTAGRTYSNLTRSQDAKK